MKFTHNHKNIGTYNEDQRIFRKRVKKSRHLFKLMDAWGIQSSAVDALEKAGCKEIRILEEEDSEVYAIPFSHFSLISVERNFGDGKQRFASRKYFKKTPWKK